MLLFQWWPELIEVLYWRHYLLSLRLLSTLPDGPSCPPRIPRWKSLHGMEKAPSRCSWSSNRPSNWEESQSWGTCRVYLVKSQISERGPMCRPLFSLVFPNWKITRKQKFSKWKTHTNILTILKLYSTYSNIKSMSISKHIIFSKSNHQPNINELCHANNYHNGDGLHGDTIK